MTEFPIFWTMMCVCYFVGGLTIGWWITKWRANRPEKTGTGKWDYSNRRFYGEGDQ